jgi:hypothetical protein
MEAVLFSRSSDTFHVCRVHYPPASQSMDKQSDSKELAARERLEGVE